MSLLLFRLSLQWLDSKNVTNSPTDNTYQISIWSNVEAGIGITAGSLTTLRPLIRFLRDGSSSGPSHTRRSYPLSNNVANLHQSSRSKQMHRDDANQVWTGRGSDDGHGITTTIMGAQQKQTSSSEDLNPNFTDDHDTPGWRVGRSVRLSVRSS